MPSLGSPVVVVSGPPVTVKAAPDPKLIPELAPSYSRKLCNGLPAGVLYMLRDISSNWVSVSSAAMQFTCLQSESVACSGVVFCEVPTLNNGSAAVNSADVVNVVELKTVAFSNLYLTT